MIETLTICQDLLTRHLSPAENRVDIRAYPMEDSKITHQIRGWSLAPKYTVKQLRSIKRRSAKNKVDSQNFRMDAKRESKAH